jgi:hypothetical protein
MATLAESLESLSAATSVKEVTLDRLSKELRAVGLWPTGRRGGRSFAAHVEAPHLVNMLLGMAGAMPSDGPETVALLRPLRLVGRTGLGNGKPDPIGLEGGMTLGQRLEAEISAMAFSVIEQGGIVHAKQHDAVSGGWALGLTPRPEMPTARISCVDEQGNGWSDTYHPAQGLLAHFMESQAPIPGLTRHVTISRDVLWTAAELLAHTLQHIEASKIPPPPPRPRGRPRKTPVPLAGNEGSTKRPTRKVGVTSAPTGILHNPETTEREPQMATSHSGKSARRSVFQPQNRRLDRHERPYSVAPPAG